MYLGHDQFLHAPQTGEDVKISNLDDPYFKSQYYAARRFDSSAPVGAPAAAAAAAPVAAPAAPVAAPVVAAAPAVPVAAPVVAAAPVDPLQVAKAQAAVARDAAEVRRNGSIMFKAVSAQEASKARATL